MAQYCSKLKQGLWIFVSIMIKGLQKRNLKEYEDRNKARFTRKILRWKIQRLLNQAYRRTHQNAFYSLKAGFATLCREIYFTKSSQVNRTCSSKGTRNDI